MAVFNSYHNEQILKLDVKQQQPNKIPRFVQYDSALLKIELYDNGKLYDVSRANEFVVSAKRPDGSKVSGLAEYDGEFITYKLSKQDLEILGETEARLQVYEGRNRLSSLSFRYDVYEDFEAVGNPDDITLLSALLQQVRDALADAQRQGGYAENRGDFANSAGDYANKAGDSQKMRWLKWVKTVAERNSTYKNPRNGDTVYVVNVADKNGGAVYRYNSIERPAKWEEISGWDTSIIQDIYNMLGDLESKKETKVKVASLVKQLQEDLENTRFGARNLIRQTDTSVSANDVLYSPVNSNSEVSMVNTDNGRVVQARIPANASQSYYGATVGNSSGRRISVREGETLTLSFLGTKSLTATDFTYVYLMRPGSEGTNRAMTLKLKHDVDASGYDKYEFNVTVPWSSDNAYILIGANKRSEYGNDNAFWVRFKDVMLVRGNRAADYSVAPEDLIRDYDKKIEDLRKDMNDNFVKIENENKNHKSRIEVLENKITMTVKETSYNTKIGKIEEWQSEYAQTARNIQTTVSKKVDNTKIISTINQTPEKISISANKIDLNGDLTVENGVVKVRQLTSSNGMNTLNLNQNRITMASGTGTISISSTGMRYKSSNGATQFQVTPELTTTGAFGTNTANVYMAAQRGYEARFVEYTGLPGDGYVRSYQYIDARGKTGYFNGIAANSDNTTLWLGSDTEIRVGNKGFSTLNTLRAAEIDANAINQNTWQNSASNMYVRARSGGEVRFTVNSTTENYIPVRASKFIESSSEKFKTNIRVWENSVLDDFRNGIQLYEYNLKTDLDAGREKRLHGVVVERETPHSWIDEDGVNSYEMTSWLIKGVQELTLENDRLKEELSNLRTEINSMKK